MLSGNYIFLKISAACHPFACSECCRNLTYSPNQAHLSSGAMNDLPALVSTSPSLSLSTRLLLSFSPRLSPFCTAPSVWVYIYHPCVRPGEWARGMERKTIMPSLLALRCRPPINNYGWRASPTAYGMGISSPSALPWAARPPWEPFNQATEDGQQARAKSRLTVEEKSSFFLTFFFPALL